MNPLRSAPSTKHQALSTLLTLAAIAAIALPCAALPLGLRLAARAAAVEAQTNAETPEERAYRLYAPCSAFEVTVTNGHAYTLHVGSWRSGTAVADRWVDWGDGARDANFSGTGSSTLSHTYERAGVYVVQISDACGSFMANGGVWDGRPESTSVVTAALRWGDNVNIGNYPYSGCTKLTGFVPRWNDKITSAFGVYFNCAGLTGEIPPWNDKITNANFTYQNCAGLTGAWTDDPAELMPTNITSHSFTVGGASAALRALFYTDWGGTHEKSATE